ncbi:MAG: aspartate aminotransferase family protein [bacterium]|nr:MAG: aspartate aminotransferase family protein [bacterium]
MSAPFGEQLPRMVTAVPGPASRALAQRLAAVESPNITQLSDTGPIFWVEASGANVRDADGNVYVDLTAGFSVAAAGHANERVVRALARQAERLPHALGDVHPADVKVALLERLKELAPGELGVTILASAGAEAVEAALKTAVMRTGKPGVLAFTGAYHGLTYGALATTWRPEFREPFRAQLYRGVRFAPYPYVYRWAEQVHAAVGGGAAALGSAAEPEVVCRTALEIAARIVDEAAASDVPIGAVLIEPVQGRGGFVVPPPGFLAGLRELADERGLVLIFDEVYTGFGRTGRWFACEHAGVVPDVLVVGKALTGMVPLSAAIGTPEVMSAWPPSTGEAVHTSTFLGNPAACAAALAQLAEIEERGLVHRAATLGSWLRERLDAWADRFPSVGEVRGLGLLQGVELVEDRATRRPATALARRVADAALREGVLLLTEGPAANVLAFTPPLVITEAQLEHALGVVEAALAAARA